jgi:CHAD domain-containing protein
MAYRLKPGKPMSTDLSRTVRRQVKKALDELGDASEPLEGLHEVRKRIKKVRAMLRLVRDGLGHDYRKYNRRLREVAHRLSVPRDAEASLEMLTSVRRHYPQLLTETMERSVRHGLAPKKRGAAARIRPGELRRTLLAAASHLPRAVRRSSTPSVVSDGMSDSYRRARRAMRKAQEAPEDLRFHAWRRRVKDHWYQVRLFEAVHPQARRRSRMLKRLEKELGDEHNLVLLRTTLLESPSTFGDERVIAIVLGCIEKYQATLRRSALRLGERLFREQSLGFGKWLEAMR